MADLDNALRATEIFSIVGSVALLLFRTGRMTERFELIGAQQAKELAELAEGVGPLGGHLLADGGERGGGLGLQGGRGGLQLAAGGLEAQLGCVGNEVMVCGFIFGRGGRRDGIGVGRRKIRGGRGERRPSGLDRATSRIGPLGSRLPHARAREAPPWPSARRASRGRARRRRERERGPWRSPGRGSRRPRRPPRQAACRPGRGRGGRTLPAFA